MKTKFITLVLLLLALQYQPLISIAEPLQGSVKVNERLLRADVPALDPALSPGNTFDKDIATALLKNEIPQNVWYKIPTSLAGSWETHEATQTYAKDEITKREYRGSRTDVNITKGTNGFFPSVDKNYWWQFADSDYWGKTEREDHDIWFFYRNVELINVSADGISLKSLSIEFEVDKTSKKILKVCQRETLSSETRITDDLVQDNEFARQYGFNGKPLRTFRLTANRKRTSIPMVNTVTTGSGRNATELILAYFEDHNMQDEYQNIIRITQNPDHLPKLDRVLMPGNTFNKDLVAELLGKKALENKWVKIPFWFAGTFEVQNGVRTYTKNMVTGQEDFTPHPSSVKITNPPRGYFPSKDGWWQFQDAGYWVEAANKDSKAYAFLQGSEYLEPIQPGAKNLTTKSLKVVFVVNPINNKIANVAQAESTGTFTDDLQQKSLSKIYDANGVLISDTHTAATISRVKEPFVRTTTNSGRDATKLLFTFLLDHKMSDEARTVIDTMLGYKMYAEAAEAKTVLDAMLPVSPSIAKFPTKPSQPNAIVSSSKEAALPKAGKTQ